MDASVVVRRTIVAPPERIWAAVRAIDGLDRWFPVIATCKVEGTGVGAMRVMGLEGGGELHDRIEEIDESARRLRYLRVVHPFPVTRYLGTVEVLAQGPGSAELRWTIDMEVEPADREATAAFLFQAISDGVAGMAGELEQAG
jgi:uncharacterized protein YndB with AHSA1/START domain